MAQNDTWRRVEGPYGGYMRGLVMDSKGYLFALSFQCNLYRSTDRGMSWHLVFAASEDVHVMALDRMDHLYLGLEEKGLILTTDGGDTWTCVGSSFRDVIAIAFNDSGHVYVGTRGDGLYVSRDRLKSWIPLRTPEYQGLRALLTTDKDRILISNCFDRGGISNSLSTDGGMTWQHFEISSPLSINLFAVSPSGHYFAGGVGGVYRSQDRARHWKRVDSGFRSDVVGCIQFDSAGNLFVGTDEPDRANGLYYSTDEGDHWTEIQTGLPRASISSIIIGREGEMFLASGDGIRISTDRGMSWRLSNRGIADLSITCLSGDPDGNIFAGASYGRLFKSTNDGLSWSNMALPDPDATPSSLEIDSSGAMYLSSSRLFISHDRGNTWSSTDAIVRAATSIVVLDRKRAIAFFHHDRFGMSRFMETVDQGEHWNRIETILDTMPVNTLSRGEDGNLYALTAYVQDARQGKVLRSADGGKTWQLVRATPEQLNAIHVSKTATFLSTGWAPNVSVSTDGGLNWFGHVIDTTRWSFPGAYCFLAFGQDTVYAGCSRGIFRSTDTGTSWAKCPSEPHAVVVQGFCRTSRGKIFARTTSGIYLLGR